MMSTTPLQPPRWDVPPRRQRAHRGQTQARREAPELTDSNGVGCAMRPRPAKDSDARPEDPQQVYGVRVGANPSLVSTMLANTLRTFILIQMQEQVSPAPTQEDQGDDDQGDGGHPGVLVGDASQDGIQSQKIPLGHDVRWRGEWVGVDRVVWVAEGDGGSESNQGETDGPHDSAHKVFDE